MIYRNRKGNADDLLLYIILDLGFLYLDSLLYVKKPTSHSLNTVSVCLFVFSTKTVLFLIFSDFSEVFQKCIGWKKAQLGKAEVILYVYSECKEKNMEIRQLLAGPTRSGTT